MSQIDVLARIFGSLPRGSHTRCKQWVCNSEQALFIHGGFYVRILIRNQTDRGLSTLPDLPAVYPELNGRPEHSHKRGFRSFLLYGTLQLRKFPYLLSSHRRYRLYSICRRMDLYRERTVRMVPYAFSVPGSFYPR